MIVVVLVVVVAGVVSILVAEERLKLRSKGTFPPDPSKASMNELAAEPGSLTNAGRAQLEHQPPAGISAHESQIHQQRRFQGFVKIFLPVAKQGLRPTGCDPGADHGGSQGL